MPPMFMGANQIMMRDLHIAANPFRHELDTLRDPFNIYPRYSTYQKGQEDIMNEPKRWESSVMQGRERDATVPDTSYTPFSWNKPKPVKDSNSYILRLMERDREKREHLLERDREERERERIKQKERINREWEEKINILGLDYKW